MSLNSNQNISATKVVFSPSI